MNEFNSYEYHHAHHFTDGAKNLTTNKLIAMTGKGEPRSFVIVEKRVLLVRYFATARQRAYGTTTVIGSISQLQSNTKILP